jgi:predicted dehydrogenase
MDAWGTVDEGVRVAVVGCGYWGPKHVRVLSASGAVSELCVVDPRADRLEAIARGMPGLRTFGSLTDALPHVDAVVVAAPPGAHRPIAEQAIAAGKHVLVEKPLAASATDALHLVDAAAAAGVVLMVGHTFVYNSAVSKLREIIDAGELGDLYYLDSARLNLGLYQSDVNVVYDLAPHDVSIVQHLLGREPDTVEAWGARHAGTCSEDVAYLRLGYADTDVQANIHVSWLDPCKVRRVTAVGSRRMAVYNDLAAEERVRVHDRGVAPPSDDGDPTVAPMTYRYGDITSPFVPGTEPLAVQDEHFLECVVTGRRPQTDGVAGLAVVRVLDAAQVSLREGRKVRLDEVVGGDVVRLPEMRRAERLPVALGA